MRHGSSVDWVADPGRGAERLTERLFGRRPDAKKRLRSHCLEGCGLGAKCANRGQRPQLQGRRRRRVVVSYPVVEGCGRGAMVSFVAGGADPSRGSQRFSELFFCQVTGCGEAVSELLS